MRRIARSRFLRQADRFAARRGACAETTLADCLQRGELSRELIEASPMGITVYRADTGQCVIANAAMAAIVGARPEQLLEQNFRRIASWRDSGLLVEAEGCLETWTPVQVTRELFTTFGRQIWIRANFAPFRANGCRYLLLVLQDETVPTLLTQELQAANAMLDEVGDLARVGGWELDLRTQSLYWSRMVQRIHEVEPGYTPGLAEAVQFYAPEGLPRIQAAVELGIREGKGWDLELPLVTAKGNRIWVRAIGRAVLEGEQVVRLQGVFQDITARRASDESLRQMARAVEESPVSIVITDREGGIRYANPKALQITGYRLQEVLGQNPRLFKSGEISSQAYAELWATILAGGTWRGEFHNRRKDGSLYWESASISPLRDGEGHITHFVAVKEDITERKHLEAQRETLIASLQEALSSVKTLRTLLPICAHCKKIRDEAGYWSQVESYLSAHSDLTFSHGLCPDCAELYFPKKERPGQP